MKVTNGEIWNTREALSRLMQEKFPVKTSYNLVKLGTKLEEQWKIIGEVRDGLIKTYGEKDEKGQVSIKPDSENMPKFNEELIELMKAEIEITFDKVKLPEMVASTCDKCKHNMDRLYEIEPVTLIILEKFLEV